MRAKFLIPIFLLVSSAIFCGTGEADPGCGPDLTGLSSLFLLPPQSERHLIGVGVEMPDKKRFLGFADYVGSHEAIASWIGFWRMENGQREKVETPVEYLYGGELLIKNRTLQTALGRIEEMNVTSSFLFGLTSRAPRKVRNSPVELLQLLSVNWNHLIGANPTPTSKFDPQRPHLNAVDLGASRHTFVDELYMLGEMAGKLAPLPETFRRHGDGKSSQTAEAIARIEWMIPHLKRYSDLPKDTASDVVDTLRRWQESGTINRETSDRLRQSLTTIWHSYNKLREQILVIEL